MDTHIHHKLHILIIAVAAIIFAGTASFAAPQLSYEELTTVADDHICITWVTSNETANTGIEYGIGIPTQTYITDEGSSRASYHYLTLENLYPNTYYTYRIFSTNASGDTTYGAYKTVQTLNPPSGQLLFTFATVADTQVTQSYHDTYGARGRPYNSSEAILDATVDWINSASPSFTIVKGDLIDSRTTNSGNDATRIKNSVANFNQQIFPIPGNHEKETWNPKTGGGWYDTLMQPIYDPTVTPAVSGLSNYSYDTNITVATIEDSVYNYSFDYNGYHFVMLDSVRKRDGSNQCKGHINTSWLNTDLDNAASRNQKSFIFMHYDITNEAVTIPEEIIKEVTGGSSDMEKIDLDNRADFLSVLDTHKANIVGLFMGHIHDNNRYYRSGFDFPFVRTAATIQFPVGFNIYKVYSNGYMQLFYKVPHYTEYAREFITPEAGYSDTYWEQFSLASNYGRNFVQTYSAVEVPPTISRNAPADNATNVALNQPVIINFSKQMLTSETETATVISPNVSGIIYGWTGSNTTLTIDHNGFAASTNYSVTIGTGAKSSDNITFTAASTFEFTTGTTVTTTAPQATIDPITNDITNDPTPTFTGIATDETSTISNIEFRHSSNSWSDWSDCTALDGAFDSTQESFTFTITPEVARGEHEIELRTTNAAGITSQTSFAAYSFYYVGARPHVILKSDSTEIINGDPIGANPSFEVTVVTDKGLTLSNLTFRVNGTAETATATSQLNNRTRTYAYYHPTFTPGTHDVRAQAIDDNGNITTSEAVSLTVQTSGAPSILGLPLTYPNPFDPGIETATISYSLSRSSNVELRFFDLSGNQIAKQNYTSSQDGGKAGYNEVTWDGRSGNGNIVGNGIYIYIIIADGNIVQNGKGKLTVFKR
ncbi:MAG: Ig-like domain-containing protein [Candidatus Margulisiibacteriota bacterium]|nr:Ig-like domain-containing protein [Candidatus Margulisiibacteriota bacterium]